jgi:hypothetical protein
VWAGKLTTKILKLAGKGATALPGKVVRNICPDILKYLAGDMKIICVTGTNGKTTTCHVIRDMIEAKGNTVFCNDAGANLLNGVARVNGICGLILLPDDWVCPAGCKFSPGFGNYDNQTYTISEWIILENAGAVFLPAAGNRYGSSVNNVQTWGFYWSSTAYDTYSSARCLEFTSSQARVDRESYCYGLSVRLVKVVQ